MPATYDVTTQREEYKNALPKWQQVEDAAAGEAAVKARGDKYLPRPNPADKSNENSCRFDQYLARAVFYNATGRTLNGLTGVAFREFPQVELPAALQYALDDISGAGVSLVQQAHQTVRQVLQSGRAGLLVDYPPTVPGTVSRADENSGAVRPTISYYPASAIINWRTVKRAGKTRLGLVVLMESHEKPEGFGVDCDTQYRVLRLEPVYQVEIWRKRKTADGKEEWFIAETYLPKRGDGTDWTEIPFTFVGSEDNDWDIDSAPLYDLAILNLAHYRNSADYEDSAYFVGQPQVWVMGVDETWLKIWKDNNVYLGSRSIGAGPPNASVTMMQAQPNTLCGEAMKSKEGQMAALGARLLMPGGATQLQKTATQVESDDATAHSVLSLVCDNVSAAYRIALGWFALFARVDGKIAFEIPTDFSITTLDAQTLTALIAAVQGGKLPESDFWTILQNVGWIDPEKTPEQIREEIAAQAVSTAATALGQNDNLNAPPGGA